MSRLPTNSAGSPDSILPAPEAQCPRVSIVFRVCFRKPAIIARLACAAVAALVIAGAAVARDYHSNPWLLSWIPATCCVTNDCCWEISEREVRPLPDDEWQVVSTGQVRKRTDWSPDGKFYRCACDYDQASKHWIKHQGANTRCLFVPMRSAAARWLGIVN